ncbi:beta-ketoacyl synthase N-terminal-like domain-containing protein [Streptomyces sp. NPDC057236]|uniref:beta-ketoacyl synthase N-terminal-like domain-containing protein n=1 Tax=Streptomyces sp. NPDC057236 TaxID=3346059 RepID=UPI0036334C1A
MAHVVVTGMGCVSPFGEGVDAFVAGLRTGRAAEPPRGFDVAGYRVKGVHHVPATGSDSRRLPLRLAESALAEAFRRAGVARGSERGCGLALASTSAGWHLPDETLDPARPPLRRDADVTALLKEGPGLALAERWGLDGPHCTVSSACASSTGALAWATERIRDGQAPMMAVGAVDVLTEVVFAGFHSMRLLTSGETRPFTAGRSGFVLAEGAAFLVLEDAEHARRRGARPLASVAGWGGSSDAAHITTPTGEGIARSLRDALADSGRKPAEVRVYHAHGTASAASDTAEAEAVTEVLDPGEGTLRVTATKSAVGHTEGAAGLFTAVAAVAAIGLRRLPPVLGVDEAGPATPGLPLHTAPAEDVPAAPALVHASGFGGANCTVLLDAPDTTAPVRRGRARPVTVRLAVRADAGDGVRLIPFDGSGGAAEAGAEAAPAAAPSGRVSRLLGRAVGAALDAVGRRRSAVVREGGLLTGTAFGVQEHHARMHEAIRDRGGRFVDPLDFARSTFNVPVAECAAAHRVRGRTETHVGPTAGAEALVSAVGLVAAGRREALLVAGYDAPENRLWHVEGDAPVPARATVLLVEAAGDGPGDVRVTGHRRLAPTSRALAAPAVLRAVAELDGDEPAEEVWADLTGLPAPERAAVDEALRDRPYRPVNADAGAAAILDTHVAALTRLAGDGGPRSLTVLSTAAHAPGVAVRYERGGRD